MEVYFIRHGQSVGNEQKRHCGWSQTPLSSLGHKQSMNLRKYLCDISFDQVYSSDLTRALETCADALPGAQPIPSSKIREIDVGTISGELYAECAEKIGEPYIKSEREQNFSLFGGEDQEQMHTRIQSFIHDLEGLKNVEKVAVFCHEGTIHQMINYVFGQDIPLQKLCIQNASVTVFSLKDGLWQMTAFNFTGKL